MIKIPRLLFVIHGVGYGGAGKMLVFLANALSKKEYNVILYTFESNKCHYSLSTGVKHISSEIIMNNKFLKAKKVISNIREKINLYKPDAVIAFLSDANTYSYIASKLSKDKPPVIICERGDPYNDHSMFSKVMQRIFKNADGAVFQTEGAQAYFGKGLKARSTIIPNPVIKTEITLKPFIERNDEIIFVARFDLIQKRQDLMIRAFKLVHDKYPNMKLIFVGDGPDIEIIKELAISEGLRDSVIFLGSIKNTLERISKSKIFAMTSDFEGIPNSLIEAMSIGLPVVSTDMSPGGARLLISNEGNGLIVPVRDIDSIANAIIFYIENPEIADTIGCKAQKISEDYSEDKIINMWSTYIKKVIRDDGN